ncbi:MAG: cytochrome P450 [Novosphingobium sp.]|nr:cytochrome P450 [Novosphingobium sp.]MCP5403486.1 cytochrome P450 [Novosphingobium sp.]
MTRSAVADAPSLDIDLYAPEILPDPWPVLARIRDAGPIVWNEQGYWMTAHDRVCRQIMNQPDAIGQEGLIASLFGEEAFISIDERAMHNALRNVWVSAFGKDGVEALVPFVRNVVGAMMDAVEEELRDTGQVDLVPALSRPLPAHVIAHMMGVSEAMTPTVIAWADRMADATAGGLPIDYDNCPYWLASEQAKQDLAAFLIEQIRYRRGNPGDDLVSRMVHSPVGSRISEQAMMVNLRQLLFAGNETTSNWLGHIVVALADHPRERRALRGDRSLLPAALEEVLRWQGVTQVLPRGVKQQGVAVAGQDLPVGAEVVLLLGAAGRDPERYERPDAFDIRREPKPHLAFGFGLHSCLGAALARMEALEVASAILDRLPEYRVARPLAFGNFSLRGPTSVWIERIEG